MYVYEVLDHQLNKLVGIYTSKDAAISKIIDLAGDSVSTRYWVWPRCVRDVIYEAVPTLELEDPKESEHYGIFESEDDL